MGYLYGLLTLGILLSPVTFASKRNPSDHFDGKKFFNPTNPDQKAPGIIEALRLMRDPRPEWPKNVQNVGIPNVNGKLGLNDIAITFVNHATFLIQVDGLNILTDPVWSKRVSPVGFVGPARVRAPGIELEDLPKIDVILISHNHYDHLDTDTLKEIHRRHSPKIIVPIGDKDLIQKLGVKDVQEFDWWDGLKINSNTHITFTPTQHSSARGLHDRDHSLWGSYFIKYRNRSVYFGGDAGYSSHYKEIKKRLGAPDIALLGIGAYAPSWFMQPLHMSPAEAVVAHKDLGAKLSIGMHYGTFQMASEGFEQPLTDLKAGLLQENIPFDSFITMDEGETRVY